MADKKAARLKVRIAEAAGAVASIRLLGRNGYTLADAKAQATLAVLHNLGLFSAGAVLVGSHAFGALLNKLGVRAHRMRPKTSTSRAAARLHCPSSSGILSMC